MDPLLNEIRHSPMLWLLALVPVALAAAKLAPEAHTLLQIALFVAPVLVLLSYVIGPMPMDLQFWPGALVMVFVATLVAPFITSGGRSAWFVGVLLLLVYGVFAITLYLLPPQVQ